jgi:DNA-binding response OmpR family regulator
MSSQPPSSPKPPPAPGLRVLLVEDDAMIGELLGEMLEEMGHRVYPVVATQADAVSAAASRRPDLMIVDVGLGTGSGIAAMDEILRAGFVTHLYMSGNVAMFRMLKPNAPVLEKPFYESELEGAISRAIETSEAQRLIHAREARRRRRR